MTLDEAIKHIEKIAEENQRIADTGILFDNVTIDMLYCDDTEVIEEHLANYQKCAERHRQFAEWLKELKQLREQTRWIPVKWIPNGRWGYPKLEDEYKHFLTVDDKGEQTVQEFLLSLDEEPQPYFTGMRNIVAWMPLPESYKTERNNEK